MGHITKDQLIDVLEELVKIRKGPGREDRKHVWFNKEERVLMNDILISCLNSKSAKRYIIEKFGPLYVKIAQNLIKKVGG